MGDMPNGGDDLINIRMARGKSGSVPPASIPPPHIPPSKKGKKMIIFIIIISSVFVLEFSVLLIKRYSRMRTTRRLGEYFGDNTWIWDLPFCKRPPLQGSWHEGRKQGYRMYTFRNGDTKCGEWDCGNLKSPLPQLTDVVHQAVQWLHSSGVSDEVKGQFSTKSDVFSFGVLVLEIVSGRRNQRFELDHSTSLLGHAWDLWREGDPMEMMDKPLREHICKTKFLRLVQIGLLCAQQNPEHRPTMSNVVCMLMNETMPLPEPTVPGFLSDNSSLNGIVRPLPEVLMA